MVATILLVAGGGLAIGGSFGKLEEEAEHLGSETLTLTYTAWHLTQGGSYPDPIYFHAPHFGIPLLITGLCTMACGLLLLLGRGRMSRFVKPMAVGATGLLVGTVWTVGLVVSADLAAVTHSEDFDLTWTSGAGFWIVLVGGVCAMAGGLITLFGDVVVHDRPEPPTPPLGVPIGHEAPPAPPSSRSADPLGGQSVGPPQTPLFLPPAPPLTGPGGPA